MSEQPAPLTAEEFDALPLDEQMALVNSQAAANDERATADETDGA